MMQGITEHLCQPNDVAGFVVTCLVIGLCLADLIKWLWRKHRGL